tara:strand:- start:1013 stop:1192 length:180 start_codon:yes stop_codon:yes gene_type:complete
MTVAIQQTATMAVSQSAKLIAVVALLGGLGIVYLTGFSHADAVHNVAHDTRHSMAFPCH